MHTLTVLFPVLISHKSFSCFVLYLFSQVNKIFVLLFPFLLPFFPTCQSSFFFSIVFSTNIFSIKHSLSTYYAPISHARMCETQFCPWRSLSSTKGERHIMKLLLKENTYTLEMCPKYRDEKWRREWFTWRKVVVGKRMPEEGSVGPCPANAEKWAGPQVWGILEECQPLLGEKEHPLPRRAEYLWRQLSIHNINGLVFFSLGLCCTWIDGNDHLKVNVSMGKTKEKNFN